MLSVTDLHARYGRIPILNGICLEVAAGEFVGVLQRLHQTQALTIVLVEQNLEFIAELAKRVLLIQKGTILRELQPGELLQARVLSEFVGVDRA